MKSAKKLIKPLLPKFVFYLAYLKKHLPYIIFDSNIFITKSNSFFKNNSERKLKADIVMHYHSLEKGISMTNRKLPFGIHILKNLIYECEEYGKLYGYDDLQVNQAVKIMFEYYNLHIDNNHVFDTSIEFKLLNLFKLFKVDKGTQQLKMSKYHYCETGELNFFNFSKTRISNRNYSLLNVPNELIDKALELSLNYPSACNRQPGRVYVISNDEKIREVLSYQTGNRGFGHLTNKLIIVTCDISGYSDSRERNLVWVDGGLFSMNILYALHYYGLAACPLNWAVKPNIEKEVHLLCNIPESERIVLMISCGFPKDEFIQPISLRYKLNDVLKYV